MIQYDSRNPCIKIQYSTLRTDLQTHPADGIAAKIQVPCVLIFHLQWYSAHARYTWLYNIVINIIHVFFLVKLCLNCILKKMLSLRTGCVFFSTAICHPLGLLTWILSVRSPRSTACRAWPCGHAPVDMFFSCAALPFSEVISWNCCLIVVICDDDVMMSYIVIRETQLHDITKGVPG